MTPAELKVARKALGLSQEKLGLALGRNPRTVRRWEDSRIINGKGPKDVPFYVKVMIEREAITARLAEVLESITDRFEDCLEATHVTRTDRMEIREARAAIALTKKDPPIKGGRVSGRYS